LTGKKLIFTFTEIERIQGNNTAHWHRDLL
jgi:hypothetical protein